METTPRIERLTREALGGPFEMPKSNAAATPDPEVTKWQRIRRIVSAVILVLFTIGLWAIGLVTAIRPIA